MTLLRLSPPPTAGCIRSRTMPYLERPWFEREKRLIGAVGWGATRAINPISAIGYRSRIAYASWGFYVTKEGI